MKYFKVLQNISSQKIPLFIKLSKLVLAWNILPLKWDSKSRPLLALVNPRSKYILVKRRLLYVVTLVMIAEILFWLSKAREVSIMDVVQVGCTFEALVTMSCHMYSATEKAPETVLLVNSLFQFIRKREAKTHEVIGSLIGKLNILMACGYYVAGTIVGTHGLVFVLIWVNPCNPSLVGYNILPECCEPKLRWTFENNVIKTFLLLGYDIVLSLGAQTLIHVMAIVQCLGTTIQVDCLTLYLEELKKARSSTVQRACESFRELQVFGNLNNHIQQGIMTSSVLVAAILCSYFSFTAIILLTKKNPLEQVWIPIAFFAIVGPAWFLTIQVTFGGMSGVYKESRRILLTSKCLMVIWLETGLPRQVRSWQKRFFNSCTPIKVKFAAENFVEELTPLNAVDFSLGLVVQLLLLSNT